MKHKLINKQTGVETICNKVIYIDGFDYYVSDEKPVKSTKPCYCYNSIKNNWDSDIVFYQGVMPMYYYKGFKIIIATNNPNIDIPKVVEEAHPFNEEDMIDFAEFYFREEFNSTMQDCKSSKEILQLWKEQQPKIVYYE